jgi:hypothetical protein
VGYHSHARSNPRSTSYTHKSGQRIVSFCRSLAATASSVACSSFLVFKSSDVYFLTYRDQVPHSAKFGGATGQFNAHVVAFPDTNWVAFGDRCAVSLLLASEPNKIANLTFFALPKLQIRKRSRLGAREIYYPNIALRQYCLTFRCACSNQHHSH